MRIVVTGSSGFIGNHLCRRLHSAGHKIRSCDIISGVRDCDFLPHHNEPTDFIFHLASPVGCRKVMLEKGVYSNIIRGAAAAIECADRLGAKLVAFSSAEAPYGMLFLGTRGEYPKGKSAMEYMVRDAPCKSCIIRPHNVIGIGQDPDAGFVVPRFIRAKRDNKPLPIFGNGNQKRVFTSVHDVVDFCMVLMANWENRSLMYNIGNPSNSISINGLAGMIGGKVEHVSGAESYGIPSYQDMPSRGSLDISSANKLGWNPTRLLPEILKEIEYEYRNDRA